MKKLTQKRLKVLLTYDPRTGVFRWRVSRRGGKAVIGNKAGGITPRGYWFVGLDNRHYLASRLAWLYMTGDWPENGLDHVNTNKSDNRFRNLRLANQSENLRNRGAIKNKASRLPKGVVQHKKGFQARIGINYKMVCLGTFPAPELAAAAYARAAAKLHGEFARTH